MASDRPDPSIFLERTKRLLEMLGNPQNEFKVLHIAGTSGKGTLAMMVDQALSDSGIRSGCFTSPFMTNPCEMIRVLGECIDEASFELQSERVREASDILQKMHPLLGAPSTFESLFALALLQFRESECEYVILEAGLGGRWDATNIVEKPFLSVITNIGLDHQELLGDTVEKIAADKAGVIKAGTPFFTAAHQSSCRQLMMDRCMELGAVFHWVGPFEEESLAPFLQNHYLANALLKACGVKNFSDSGLHKISRELSGRQELVQRNPSVVLDGAHNDDKIAALISSMEIQHDSDWVLVLALDSKRDPEVLAPLIERATFVVFTDFIRPERESWHASQLHQWATGRFQGGEQDFFEASDPQHAMKQALEIATEEDLVLVTGSFYLVGNLRPNWVRAISTGENFGTRVC